MWVLFTGFKVICQNVAYIIKVQSVYVFSKGRLGMSDVTHGPFFWLFTGKFSNIFHYELDFFVWLLLSR